MISKAQNSKWEETFQFFIDPRLVSLTLFVMQTVSSSSSVKCIWKKFSIEESISIKNVSDGRLYSSKKLQEFKSSLMEVSIAWNNQHNFHCYLEFWCAQGQRIKYRGGILGKMQNFTWLGCQGRLSNEGCFLFDGSPLLEGLSLWPVSPHTHNNLHHTAPTVLTTSPITFLHIIRQYFVLLCREYPYFTHLVRSVGKVPNISHISW